MMTHNQLQVCQLFTQLLWSFIKPHEKDWKQFLVSDVCDVSPEQALRVNHNLCSFALYITSSTEKKKKLSSMSEVACLVGPPSAEQLHNYTIFKSLVQAFFRTLNNRFNNGTRDATKSLSSSSSQVSSLWPEVSSQVVVMSVHLRTQHSCIYGIQSMYYITDNSKYHTWVMRHVH